MGNVNSKPPSPPSGRKAQKKDRKQSPPRIAAKQPDLPKHPVLTAGRARGGRALITDDEEVDEEVDEEADEEADEEEVDDEDGAGGSGRRSNGPDPSDFIASRYHSNPATDLSGVFAPHWAVIVTNSKAELLVLSQLAYWFGVSKAGKIRAQIEWGRYRWVYKTHGKLGKEIGLSKDQVRNACRKLVTRRLLVVDIIPGETPYYRIDPAGIEAAEKQREKILHAKKHQKKKPHGFVSADGE